MKNEIILIVDDNPLNLKLLNILLNSAGYETVAIAEAEKIDEALEKHKPKLILLDIQMPRKDGYTICKEIKSNPKYINTSIIAVSAYAMKGDDEKAFSAGFDDYITKPINSNELLTLVKKYLT